jgi:flagellar biosynthetic protein FliQ
MTPESVMTLGRQGMEVMLMISAPLLIVTLVVGLIIGVFQAATQINDASLSFVPKLVAVVASLIIAGPWILTIMTAYMRRLLTDLPGLIG